MVDDHAGRARPDPVAHLRDRRREPRGARDARDPEQRQADRGRSARRHPEHRGDVPLLRGLGDEGAGQDDPDLGRQLPHVHATRARRRLRRDHPVELPADDGGLEAGARARVRQRDDHEAGRADAALDAAARGADGRGRPARRRRERPERPGRDHRPGDRRPPRHRQGRVHGIGRGRTPDHEGLDGEPQARLARARRQVPERVLRRRTRGSHRRRGVGHLLQHGTGLHRGLAPVRPVGHLRRGDERPRRGLARA